MGKYIVKRVLLLIPTILIVCVIVFALMRMVPGDAVDVVVNKLTAQGRDAGPVNDLLLKLMAHG